MPLRATIVAHGRQRPQRVLGSGLRDSGGRSRAELAAARHQARRRQPGARRGRHAGAARRRAGRRPKQATRRQAVAQARSHACAPRNSRSSASSSTAPTIRCGGQHRAGRSSDVSTGAARRRGAVRRALHDAHRPRAVASKQIQRTTSRSKSCATQQLPALDLTASYGVPGIGGTAVHPAPGAASARAPSQIIPGGFSDALSMLATGRAPTWNFRVELQLSARREPRRGGNARARACSSADDRAGAAARAAGRDRSHQRGAARSERTASGSRPPLSARELAERRLDAEQSRFEVGLSTNFFVVQAQRDLRDAQNAELRALLDYRRAQVDFERVQEIPAAGGCRHHHDPARRRQRHRVRTSVVAATSVAD